MTKNIVSSRAKQAISRNSGKPPLPVKAIGFTLIEVLLALAIIAISLTALLKATAETVSSTNRIKDKLISHWVAQQGIVAIQLGLVSERTQTETTQVTQILGQQWYWRIKRTPGFTPSVEQITITVSKKQAGPFRDPLIGFKYNTPEKKDTSAEGA